MISDIATQRLDGQSYVKRFQILVPQELTAKIDENIELAYEKIRSDLEATPSVSVSVDTCSAQDKSLMIVTANWIDSIELKRKSRLIGCEAITHNESITDKLEWIYTKYGIDNKILATIKNNISNEFSNPINEMEILTNPIDSPTYLFKMIATEDAATAKTNSEYADKWSIAFDKFNTLRDSRRRSDLSEEAKRILKEIFGTSADSYTINDSITNLIKFDVDEVMTELYVPVLTADDLAFLKEYAMVMEPIVTTIEYLEKNDCFYATHLPMVYSTKTNLDDLLSNGKIQHCQPLLTAIANGLKERFVHLFNFYDEKCLPAIIATCTHPFFKMRWLKGEMKTPIITNHILNLLVKAAKECDTQIEDDASASGAGTSQSKGIYSFYGGRILNGIETLFFYRCRTASKKIQILL